MEGVVANPKVRERLDKIAVGLAAHCDPPDVEQKLLLYFTEKFADASSLPFAAFMTHDFQYIRGFHDARSLEQFLADLDFVEKSPLLPATAADAAKLDALGERATAAARKQDWAVVASCGARGAAIRGRCREREPLDAAFGQAHAWAAGEFAYVVEAALSGEDQRDLRAALSAVEKAFKGQPEAALASGGRKALEAYARLARVPQARRDAAREDAAKRFAQTPWADIFE